MNFIIKHSGTRRPFLSYLICITSFILISLRTTHSAPGTVTYTITKSSKPTADQSDAYAKIKIAMDSAVSYYNVYTSITKKITASYEPTVPTADGNINGSIRFGSNRSYMSTCTAMHEIAHTVGIGQLNEYKVLIVNGVFTGKNATQKLKDITNDQKAILYGDVQHFWPYGLNYASEVKSTSDFINHCKIVDAMQKDFFPTQLYSSGSLDNSPKLSFCIVSRGIIQFTIPRASTVQFVVYSLTGKLIIMTDTKDMTAGSFTKNIGIETLLPGGYIVKCKTNTKTDYRFITLPR